MSIAARRLQRSAQASVALSRATWTDPATPRNVQPAGLSGWGDPVFSEEFDGAVTVIDAGSGYVRFRDNGPTWATWYPDWPMFWAESAAGPHTNTDQLSYYATNKVGISGGALTLACDRESSFAGLPYTAGMITSMPTLTPLYGFFEARIKLDAAPTGVWPAAWLTAAAYNTWPPEIDFMEMWGGSDIEVNVFLPSAGKVYNKSIAAASAGTSWHTWGVSWKSTGVTFYLDGVQVGQTTQTPTSAQYLIFNNGAASWMNPSFTNSSMKVEYVRIWELNGAYV